MNVGVAGAACTTRELDLIRFHEAMTEHGDAALARAQASRFNVLTTFNNKQTRKIHNRDGFFTLAAVGMAVCLIRKTALKAMVKSGALDRRVNIIDGVEHPSWGFFDQHNIGATVLLEDYSFCYRWVEKMQRPLWVCVDCTVRHLGDFAYGAAYLPLLQGKLKKSLKFEEIEKPGGAENIAE